MKKSLALLLATVLGLSLALAGCSGKSGSASDKTAEELTELYSSAITDNGGEMVEYNPVFTEVKEDDMSAIILENLGLLVEDMKAFAVSSSVMNVQAYGIAAVMPADGKAETVTSALQSYIDAQRAARRPSRPGSRALSTPSAPTSRPIWLTSTR